MSLVEGLPPQEQEVAVFAGLLFPFVQDSCKNVKKKEEALVKVMIKEKLKLASKIADEVSVGYWWSLAWFDLVYGLYKLHILCILKYLNTQEIHQEYPTFLLSLTL